MKTIGISMPTGMENDAIREREERSEEESKSITIDENGVRSEVVYEEGKQTYKTGSGEVGSPEQIREAEYYKYGGIPKSITYGDVKNEYVYDTKCRISKLKCGDETYNYVYDDRDRVISVDKSGEKLVEYTYRGSDVSGVKTGNVSRSFTYDVKGRITEVKKCINGGAYTEEMTAEYLGDAKDTVKITSGGTVTTTRRGSGKVLNEYESEDESLKMSVKAYVDEVSDGAVTSSSVCELYKVSNNEAGKEYTCIVKQEEAVSRDSDGKVKEVGYAIEGDTALFGNSYEYDDLGRLTKEKVFADLDMRIARIGFAEEYDYADVGSRASGLVKEQRLSYGNVDKAESLDRDKISYTYYTNGNVKSIYTGSPTDGKLLAKYGYDAKNRLVSESSGNETTTYAYDAKGNVTERKVIYNDGVTPDRTDVYEYSGDKLVSYNGNAVTYDSIGNPLSYIGKTFTWEGRRLKSVTSRGSTLDFAYNYEGMRTKKGNVRYFYVGNRLVSEVRGNVTILYRYGVKGLSSIVVKKDEDTQKYVCRTNIFGDVIAIYNTEGDLQCKYNYDVWGNHRIGNARNELIYNSVTGVIATGYENHIAILNPIRYRGYYYDNETRLFWLSSRYYSPKFGRFMQISDVSDLDPHSINGLNLYAYANNNPIRVAYVNFSVGVIINSLAIDEIVVPCGGLINKGFYWSNLDFLGTGFGYIENSFSMIVGVIDGVRKIKHLDKLVGLDKASNWLMGISIGINVGLSLYKNLTNSNLSDEQKAGNILGDIVYIAASSAATWGVSALTAMIPIIGPIIAPIVGVVFGIAFDRFWYGENILGINGFFSIQEVNQLMNGLRNSLLNFWEDNFYEK